MDQWETDAESRDGTERAAKEAAMSRPPIVPLDTVLHARIKEQGLDRPSTLASAMAALEKIRSG